MSQDWDCTAGRAEALPVLIAAVGDLANAAMRLAASQGAVAWTGSGDPPARATRLVVISDATDFDEWLPALEHLDAPLKRLVLVGKASRLAATAMGPDWEVRSVDDEAPELLFRGLTEAMWDDAAAQPALSSVPPVFLSHAVVDEAVLLPAVDYLRRRLGIEVFVCADSIDAGSRWHDSIITALRERPRFLLIVSQAARQSPFCAFELGYAMALGKDVRLVSLDGSPPPAYIQHVQAVDAVRRRSHRPWLTKPEALVESLLEALS